MGRALCQASAAARAVYASAADCLGRDPLAFDASQLAQTQNAQPAIVTLSLAAWHALQEQWGDPAGRPVALQPAQLALAGFSLGEYSALGAAGVLALPDLLRLVQERARLMQLDADDFPGAMYAILGLDDATVLEVLDLGIFRGRVFAVNFNAPGQLVISGEAAITEACAGSLKLAGARRAVRLAVSGAFHTPLMSRAAERLQAYAAGLDFRTPRSLLYGNGTAAPLAVTDWPAYLAEHLCHPVRWTDEIRRLRQDGMTACCELGPGKVLTGLVRKILPDLACWAVEDDAGLILAAAGLGDGVGES
jgi:[acyl-carrier-protein] S-malonyltransferase